MISTARSMLLGCALLLVTTSSLSGQSDRPQRRQVMSASAHVEGSLRLVPSSAAPLAIDLVAAATEARLERALGFTVLGDAPYRLTSRVVERLGHGVDAPGSPRRLDIVHTVAALY